MHTTSEQERMLKNAEEGFEPSSYKCFQVFLGANNQRGLLHTYSLSSNQTAVHCIS